MELMTVLHVNAWILIHASVLMLMIDQALLLFTLHALVQMSKSFGFCLKKEPLLMQSHVISYLHHCR